MSYRAYHRGYRDEDADYTVGVALGKTYATFAVHFRRFPVIRDAISGDVVPVDAGAHFEGLLELVHELVLECCDDEAEHTQDAVRRRIADAYRARMRL